MWKHWERRRPPINVDTSTYSVKREEWLFSSLHLRTSFTEYVREPSSWYCHHFSHFRLQIILCSAVSWKHVFCTHLIRASQYERVAMNCEKNPFNKHQHQPLQLSAFSDDLCQLHRRIIMKPQQSASLIFSAYAHSSDKFLCIISLSFVTVAFKPW